MKLINREIGLGQQPYIVAEISCNHRGSLDEARELIEIAKNNGADAAKIQVYTPDELVIDKNYVIRGGAWDNTNLYELYTKTQTPHEWVPKLFDHARNINFPIFASVFSLKGLELLEKLGCPAYKIASFECSDLRLVERCVQTGKPVIVSVSGTAEPTIIFRLSMMKPQPIVMHCTSQYPTPMIHASLNRIHLYRTMFNYVGYSDHNESLTVASHAVTAGAVVIERHLTKNPETEDKGFSLNPAQFKLYVQGIRRAGAMLAFTDHKQERIDYKQFMRCVYATKDMKKGEYITEENTATFRPYIEYSIKAQDYPSVLARKLIMPIKKGQAVTWSHLQ